MYSNVRITAIAADNEALTAIKSGDAAAYKYINFAGGVSTFSAWIAPGIKASSIDIVLDNSWNSPIGKMEIPGTEEAGTWNYFSCKIKVPTGVHAVWLRFNGAGENILRLDHFTFK